MKNYIAVLLAVVLLDSTTVHAKDFSDGRKVHHSDEDNIDWSKAPGYELDLPHDIYTMNDYQRYINYRHRFFNLGIASALGALAVGKIAQNYARQANHINFVSQEYINNGLTEVDHLQEGPYEQRIKLTNRYQDFRKVSSILGEVSLLLLSVSLSLRF